MFFVFCRIFLWIQFLSFCGIGIEDVFGDEEIGRPGSLEIIERLLDKMKSLSFFRGILQQFLSATLALEIDSSDLVEL
jgi:hypothetical protein